MRAPNGIYDQWLDRYLSYDASCIHSLHRQMVPVGPVAGPVGLVPRLDTWSPRGVLSP